MVQFLIKAFSSDLEVRVADGLAFFPKFKIHPDSDTIKCIFDLMFFASVVLGRVFHGILNLQDFLLNPFPYTYSDYDGLNSLEVSTQFEKISAGQSF